MGATNNSFQAQASGTAPIQWSLSGPAGVSIDQNTGVITGTNLTAGEVGGGSNSDGSYPVTITAQNSAGSNSQTFALTILPTPNSNDLWTGAGDGTWSDYRDWAGGVPQAGYNLIFQSGANSTQSFDDLPNLTLGNIEIDTSYQLSAQNGGSITLNGNVTVLGGASTMSIPITLSSTVHTFSIVQPVIGLQSGPGLTVAAALTGSGGLSKTGGGELDLTGSNSYSFGTALFGGTLGLGNAGALGSGLLNVQARSRQLRQPHPACGLPGNANHANQRTRSQWRHPEHCVRVLGLFWTHQGDAEQRDRSDHGRLLFGGPEWPHHDHAANC